MTNRGHTGTGLNVGVVGAGFMGSLHARVYADLSDVKLAAVADPNLPRAESAAQYAPGCAVYADYKQMFEQEQLDVVSICTLDTDHRAPVEVAAKAGIHILLEKPIATSMVDGEAIVAACAKAQVRLGVGFLLRWDPRYATVKEKLAAGVLGDPIHISVRRNSPRDEGPARYGGALPLPLHVTVHDVDMVTWLLRGKRPLHVYAQWVDKLLGKLGTQDSIFAILRFDDGTLANFASSWALPETSRTRLDARLEIVGTLGMAEVECGESGLYLADGDGATYPDTQHWPQVRGLVLGDVFNEIRAFVRDVQTGQTSCTTGEEAVETLRITLAMIESARTGTIQYL